MRRRASLRLPRSVIAPSALILCCATFGAIYQAVATRREQRLYPPPGDLIDIGGYRLHLLCTGGGQPTVVLDAGLGSFSVDWGLVAPEVAAFTAVCAYDRAGYGWSDAGPRPRTSRQIAWELHSVLHLANIPAPYVLVGHSFGGFNVRVFADAYPDEVAGLVMVDASHEDEEACLPEPLRADYQRMMRIALVVWQLGRVCSALGLIRLAGEHGLLPLFRAFDALPPRLRQIARRMRYRPRYYATCYAEDICFAESAAQVRGARVRRAIPAVVVVASGSGLSAHTVALSGRTGRLMEAMRQQKQELQQALARRLSPEASYMVAERSGHLIPLDQPEIVVEAIRRVVEAARH
ncbi:MAG TPA: alpha/beta hydrolase [Chloroflexota bacterium]|nr:alpha/beta hydrolase [Chloroflexota bacterium]